MLELDAFNTIYTDDRSMFGQGNNGLWNSCNELSTLAVIMQNNHFKVHRLLSYEANVKVAYLTVQHFFVTVEIDNKIRGFFFTCYQ